MNQGLGEPFEIPVPWYLAHPPEGQRRHRRRQRRRVRRPTRSGTGAATTEVYYPEMTPEQACVPALKAAGFDPADVKFILQSHLHLDHTGALAALDRVPEREGRRHARGVRVRPRARLVRGGRLHPGGLQQAGRRLGPARGSPTTATTSTATASIRMWQTPGHAPGHQSFEITLPNTGSDPADGRRGLHDRPLGGEGAARLPRLGRRHRALGAQAAPHRRRALGRPSSPATTPTRGRASSTHPSSTIEPADPPSRALSRAIARRSPRRALDGAAARRSSTDDWRRASATRSRSWPSASASRAPRCARRCSCSSARASCASSATAACACSRRPRTTSRRSSRCACCSRSRPPGAPARC